MGWSGCHEVRSDDQGRRQAAFELSSERAIINILCLGLICFLGMIGLLWFMSFGDDGVNGFI